MSVDTLSGSHPIPNPRWLRNLSSPLDGSPGGLPANGYESHPLAKEGDPSGESGAVAGALSEPGCQGYVRYMDDMLVFGERDMLKALRGFANDFMRQELRLEIKGGGFINRCGLGIDFLGFRVFGDRLRLSRHANAYLRKLERLDTLRVGAIDEQSYRRRPRCFRSCSMAIRSHSEKVWARGRTGSNRLIRGGSWNNGAQNCRSANRNNNNPSNRNNNNGFRLAFFPAAQRDLVTNPH